MNVPPLDVNEYASVTKFLEALDAALVQSGTTLAKRSVYLLDDEDIFIATREYYLQRLYYELGLSGSFEEDDDGSAATIPMDFDPTYIHDNILFFFSDGESGSGVLPIVKDAFVTNVQPQWIRLIFNEAMESLNFNTNDLVLTINGVAATFTGDYSGTEKIWNFKISETVEVGDVLLLSYTGTGWADIEGDYMAKFSEMPVANHVEEVISQVTLLSAAVEDLTPSTINLVFSGAIALASINIADISVAINGVNRGITTMTSGVNIDVTLASEVNKDDVVTVSYNGTTWKTVSGQYLVQFTNTAVANNVVHETVVTHEDDIIITDIDLDLST